MEHNHTLMAHNTSATPMSDHMHDMATECDGRIDPSKKGSWKGHVLPGIVFCIWGAWTLYHVCCWFLWSTMRRPYRARAWYPAAGRWTTYLEPVMKIILPPIAVSIELYWDHDHYRYLYCPEGTEFAGRFAMSHMNNWQHTATYPAFVLSGLVDLLSVHLPLPEGTSHGFLGLAFAVMSFLMATHEKHMPMDKMGHWLLYVSMVLGLAFILLETVARHHAIVGFGKALSFIMQGAWLIQLGRMEFEDHPQWTEDYTGAAMMAPFAFCMIGVTIAASAFAFHLLLAVLKERGLLAQPPFVPVDASDYTPAAAAEQQDGSAMFECDSARNSDGGESPVKKGERGRLAPFQIVHGGFKTSGAYHATGMHAV